LGVVQQGEERAPIRSGGEYAERRCSDGEDVSQRRCSESEGRLKRSSLRHGQDVQPVKRRSK
jgi:hypothetical protein